MNKILIATTFCLFMSPLAGMNKTFDLSKFTQFIKEEPANSTELKEFEDLIKNYTESNQNIDDYTFTKNSKTYNPLGLAQSYQNWSVAYVLIETGCDLSQLKDIRTKNNAKICFSDKAWTTDQLLEQALYAQKLIAQKKPFFKNIDNLYENIDSFAKGTLKKVQSGVDLQSHYENKLDIYIMTLIAALGNSILNYEKTLSGSSTELSKEKILPNYYAKIKCNSEFFNDVDKLLNLELSENGTYQKRKEKISIKDNYENFKLALQKTMPQLMSWKIAQKYTNDF